MIPLQEIFELHYIEPELFLLVFLLYFGVIRNDDELEARRLLYKPIGHEKQS